MSRHDPLSSAPFFFLHDLRRWVGCSRVKQSLVCERGGFFRKNGAGVAPPPSQGQIAPRGGRLQGLEKGLEAPERGCPQSFARAGTWISGWADLLE